MKIFIFGPSGSGKTLVGITLSEKYSLPFFELDKVFWDTKSQKSIEEEEERTKLVNEIISGEDWIIEGMYRQDWLDIIIEKADFLFVIDKSLLLLDYYLIKRTLGRIFHLENHERESSLSVLWNFLKFNHSGRFRNVHLKEFQERVDNSRKMMYFVENIGEIEKKLAGP